MRSLGRSQLLTTIPAPVLRSSSSVPPEDTATSRSTTESTAVLAGATVFSARTATGSSDIAPGKLWLAGEADGGGAALKATYAASGQAAALIAAPQGADANAVVEWIKQP